MSDVIVSKKEGSAFHEYYCPYIRLIRKKNRVHMPEEEAIEKGYCECKFCRSVRGIVYKYKQLTNMDIFYDKVDDALCVKTQVGFWKLIWRENRQEWYMYHMNHKGFTCFDPKLPPKVLMRGSFHRQYDYKPSSSISKALKYIKSHDINYKLAEEDIHKIPKTTSKQRTHYRQQKNRKRKESIKNVYKIFDELERSNGNEESSK